MFSKFVILTSELAEPSVILNWLKRIGISNDELGITVYKVTNDIELYLWTRLKDLLGLNVIFLGLCDRVDSSLKDYCVPLGEEVSMGISFIVR